MCEKKRRWIQKDEKRVRHGLYAFQRFYKLSAGTKKEKTYEEFYTEEEDYEIDTYDSLGFIKTPDIKISFEDVESDFENVFNNLNSEKSDIVKIIKKYVPDFMHIETGKHLDQKM